MKKLLLLPILLLLLFPAVSQAEEKSDREIALKTLSVHKDSQERFAAVEFSNAIRNRWESRVACVHSIADGLNASSLSTDLIFSYLISMVSWVSEEYYVFISRHKKAMIKKEVRNIMRASNELEQKAGKKGRVIARSLRGHKMGSLAFARVRGPLFNWCEMEKRVLSKGGYTEENMDESFDELYLDSWMKHAVNKNSRYAKSLRRAWNILGRGDKKMRSIRPSIPSARIDNYNNIASMSFGENDNWGEQSKAFDLKLEISPLIHTESTLLRNSAPLFP